jgi:hypothetical protein
VVRAMACGLRLPAADLDPRVHDRATVPDGAHEDRIEIDLEYLRDVQRELRHAAQQVGERRQIRGWPAAIADEASEGSALSNHGVGIAIGERRDAEVQVLLEFDVRASQAKAHDGAEQRIVRQTHHGLDPVRDHRLDQNPVRVEVMCSRQIEEFGDRKSVV